MNEDAIVCSVCGAEFEFSCPECGAFVGSKSFYCINCGTRFASKPEPEPDEPPVSAPLPLDPAKEAWDKLPKVTPIAALTSDTEDVPTCSICGRQDETVRAVAYPYVYSAIVVTQRRCFSGIWCQKHRRLRLALASLITATLGWLGIPYGFVLTPMTLRRLAQGGTQPVEPNVRLLRNLAGHKMKMGDIAGAIRALEEVLKFRDDVPIREHLRELYAKHHLSDRAPKQRLAVSFLVVLLGAILIGAIIGVSDYVITAIFIALLGEEGSIFQVILSWAPLVAMAFLGGLVLFELIEWALVRHKCRQTPMASGLAAVSALLVLYGIPEGRVVAEYVRALLSGNMFKSASEAISVTGAILTRGGIWQLTSSLGTGELFSAIYVVILLASGVYYVVVGVSVAQRAVNWQRRVALAGDKLFDPATENLAVGWMTLAGVLVVLGVFVGLFPQKETIDYLDAGVHHQRGIEYLEQNQIDEAIQELEKAVNLNPDETGFLTDLGWAYYEIGYLVAASEAFQEAIRLDPDLVSARQALGMIHFSLGNTETAIDELEAVVELAPDNAQAYGVLGFAYYWTGEPEAAGEVFETAVELDPLNPEFQAGLGLAYLGQDRLDDAENHFIKALDLSPGLAMAHYGMGEVRINENDLQQAIPYLQEALRLDPHYVQAHLSLGATYIRRAEFDEAVQQFEAFSEIQPNWGLPHAYLAHVYYQLDHLDLMEREIQSALEGAETNGYPQRMLGYLYTRLGWFPEAETQFLEAIELAPDDARTYTELAAVYTAQEQFDLAFQMCDKALELDENLAEAHIARGNVCIEQEKLDAALEHLLQALELEADNEAIHSALSFVYLHSGRTADAYSAAQQTIMLDPYSAKGYKNLAFAHYSQGKIDLALAAAQEAIRLSPKLDTAHYILGLCYLDKGMKDQVAAEFETFLALYQDGAYIRAYKIEAEKYLAQLQEE